MAEADSRPTHRVCTKCNEEKPLDEFCNAKGGKYGKSARCRDCAAAYAHANQKRINELSLARYYRITAEKKAAKEAAKTAKLAATEKRCARCGNSKPKSEFKRKKDSADGLHCHCKRCCNAINREHRAENPKMAAAWSDRWKAKNPERVKEIQRRHHTQPHVRLHASIRNRLRALMLNGSKNTFDILGFSRDELMTHLERQFLPGMSWGNYGAWHVDHVRPLSSFKISSVDDPMVREAWALYNLRPIWAKDNLVKNAKRIFLV